MKAEDKKNKNEDWKSDIKDWDKITKETANLLLEQGETLLKETVLTAESISKRADRIVTILIPLSAALATYIFNNLSCIKNFLPLTALCCFVVILISLASVYGNFKNYKINVPGEYPKNIMTTTFINNSFNNHQQFINLTMSICENLQRRIAQND